MLLLSLKSLISETILLSFDQTKAEIPPESLTQAEHPMYLQTPMAGELPTAATPWPLQPAFECIAHSQTAGCSPV